MPDKIVTLGFDPSVNATGWAVMFDRELIETGTIEATGDLKKMASDTKIPILERQRMKRNNLSFDVVSLIEKWQPDIIGIEEERVYQSTTAVLIGRVIGLIEGVIDCWHIKFSGGNPKIVDVNPKTHRGMLGLSQSSKVRILAEVQMIFPMSDIKNDHEADAVSVANAAYHISQGYA